MKIIGLIIPFFLGLSIVALILKKGSVFEKVSYSYPIGFFAITIVIFVLNLVGIALNRNNIIMVSSILILGINYKAILNPGSFYKRFTTLKVKGVSTNFFRILTFGILAYIIIGISMKNIFFPATSWDEITSFDFFARSIAAEQKVVTSIIINKLCGPGATYPPFFNFSLAYFHILGFNSPKLFMTFILLSFVLIFYSLVKKHSNATSSMFFSLFLFATPEFIAHGALLQTNLTFALYGGIGLILMYSFYNSGEKGYLYVGMLFLSVSAWLRAEGIVFASVGLFTVIYFVYAKKINRISIIYSLLMYVPLMVWLVYLKFTPEIRELEISHIHPLFYWNKEEIALIIKYTKLHILNRQMYGLTFVFFLIAFILNIKNLIKTRNSLLFLVLLIAAWVGYLALVYQLDEGTLGRTERILQHSYKRFLFIYIVMIWFYVSSNQFSVFLFNKIDHFLKAPAKKLPQ